MRTISQRQSQQIGCPEEITYVQGWIDDAKMGEHARTFGKTEYGAYLRNVLNDCPCMA